MSRIYLVPPLPAIGRGVHHAQADYDMLVRSAKLQNGAHRLMEVAEDADIIMFVGSRDPLHRDVRKHIVTRHYPEKVVLYDSSDRIIPFIRGIYPSIESSYYDARRMRSGFYLRWSQAETVTYTDPEKVPTLLYSFVGASVTHPVRKRVLALSSSEALLRDTAAEPGRGFDQPSCVYDKYRQSYGEDLARARFILCPRGVGTSSMRIFEAMKAGRVPVIISDDWVPPIGPAWESFSFRVHEADVESIPSLLRSYVGSAPRMGNMARKEWERWFSPDVAFNTLANWAVELVSGDWRREKVGKCTARVQMLRPFFLHHHIVGSFVRGLRRRLRLS